MPAPVIFLSLPGLRRVDVDAMPHLQRLIGAGGQATLVPSFPCVTWPVQANMLCGCGPDQHGVVANGFFWRDRQEVEMWTAPNDVIGRPQIWDRLHEQDPPRTSAAWFPMLSKQSGADYVCMPAPVHNPDGSESLWCYTKPPALYGELLDAHGHFPLQHFWGPLAGIQSSAWIVDSAQQAAAAYRPDFFYIYLPHLDYAAQKTGPDSPAAAQAVAELDQLLGRLQDGLHSAYRQSPPVWLVASEYTIVPVDHVSYPNRTLRAAGLLSVRDDGQGEMIDLAASRAWALVDHQFSHVFVRDADAATIQHVGDLFSNADGIAEVLCGDDRARRAMDHERSGEVILISTADSWQAYYYWLDDSRAPAFARTVDIHRKPGYDPVELHFDPATRSIPLDARLVKGSHGAPATTDAQCGVLLCSAPGVLARDRYADTDLAGLVLSEFA